MSNYESSNGQIHQRRSNKQSCWWRDLCRVYGDGDTNNWFEKKMLWRVGSGNRIKFWEDKGVGEALLKEMFKRLYSILNDKDKRIQ